MFQPIATEHEHFGGRFGKTYM